MSDCVCVVPGQAERSGLSLANQNYHLPPPAGRPYEELVRYRFQPNHNGGRQLTHHPHLFKRSASPDTPILLSPEASPLQAGSPDSLTDCEPPQRQPKLPSSPAPVGGGAARLNNEEPERSGGEEPLRHPLQPPEPGGSGEKDDSMRLHAGVPPPSNGIGEQRQQRLQEQQQLTVVKTTNRVESHYYTASRSTRARGIPAPANMISSGTNKLAATLTHSNNNNNNEDKSSAEWNRKYKNSEQQHQQQSTKNSNSWDSTCDDSGSLPDHVGYAVVKRTKPSPTNNADGGAHHNKTVMTNHRPPSMLGDPAAIITAGGGGTEDPEDEENGRTAAPSRESLHSVPSRETGAIPKQRRRRLVPAASPVPHPDEIISLPLDDPLMASPRSLAANSRQHNTYYNFAH